MCKLDGHLFIHEAYADSPWGVGKLLPFKDPMKNTMNDNTNCKKKSFLHIYNRNKHTVSIR